MEFTNVEILTQTPPPRKEVFYLSDYFVLRSDGKFHSRYYPPKDMVYTNIFEAIRGNYPKGMLPFDSKLYAIVNGEVFEGKTKKVKHFEELGDFVDYIQKTEKEEGAAIVSFGRGDFDTFSDVIEKSGRLWGISENIHNEMLFRVHVYGTPSKPRPPKYVRRK